MKRNLSLSKRNILVNILFSILIFSIFIVTIEVVLRTTHIFGAKLSWSEPDDILGYKFSAGKKYWYYEENDHPIVGRINNYGFRDKDWPLEKPIYIYRVAVLGDSMVEALQVELDRTFVAMTEYQLNRRQQRGIKVELMNFARSSCTQSEEFLILKKYISQFSTDMVMLFFTTWNDIQDISKDTAIDVGRPFYHISDNGELILDTSFAKTRSFKIRSYINWLKQHSALVSLVADRYNKVIRSKSPKTQQPEELLKKIDGYLSLCTANPSPIYLKNYQLNKALITAMAKYCKEKGIKFMLVTFPIYYRYNQEKEKRYIALDPTFNINFFEDDMKEFAKSINIEYLGLGRIFRSYEERGIQLYWNHLNYEGHKLVADSLTNKLESIIYSRQ